MLHWKATLRKLTFQIVENNYMQGLPKLVFKNGIFQQEKKEDKRSKRGTLSKLEEMHCEHKIIILTGYYLHEEYVSWLANEIPTEACVLRTPF